MNNRKKKSDKSEGDEVDQLLQAAQDEMLLKLSVDSHISHLSSNLLDSDLDRRFQALKSRPSLPPSSSKPKPQSPLHDDADLKTVLGDDLSARFATLKASSSVSSSANSNEVRDGLKISNHQDDDDDDDSEDEVDKVIRWAMDAARLDPSPPSEDDEDEDEEAVAKKKAHHK